MPLPNLLIAALPLAGVLIGAGLQYVFGRTLEARKQTQTQKAQAYADFFKAVSALAQHGPSKESLSQAADAKTRICIYAPKQVISALALFERAGPRLDNPTSREALLQALGHMRRDLGAGFPKGMRGDLDVIIYGPAGARQTRP